MRSKNLPEVRERIVHGGFVSAGADAEVELEDEAFELLFFGGGSAAITDVMSRKAGRSDCVKRIVVFYVKCGR